MNLRGCLLTGCENFMSHDTKRLLWKFVLVLNWLIILVFWGMGSGQNVFNGVGGLLVALGNLMGLAAAYAILQQFFFMGRTPWLERVFGLDKLARLHHTNGKIGLLFMFAHPVFLTLGYAMLSGNGIIAQYFEFMTDYEDVFNAFIGLILFSVVVGTSIYVVRNKLRYESWYAVHLMAYLAVIMSFGHQFAVGPDIVSNKVFYGYWAFLYVAVFGMHVLFRFVRPVWNFYKHKFFVSRMVRETENVLSIYIKGKDLESFGIIPGQFMIFRFFYKGLWWQAHPFSLSYVPKNDELRITVKQLGDFTKQLSEVPVGTKVLVDGPYGVFTDLFAVSEKVLLIAGGIGITPIRAMMEVMLLKHKQVVLLYANRTESDIALRKEIDELAQKYGANVVHILSGDEKFAGERGFVDEEKVKRLVPDFLNRDVYVCGPPPMMNGLIDLFEKLGLPSHQLHYEKFSLH